MFENESDAFIVTFEVVGDANFDVLQRDVVVASKTESKIYDGTPLSTLDVEIGEDGFVAGECVARAVGSQTNVGASKNAVVLEWAEGASASNYSIVINEGTLTVLPAKVAKGGAEPGAGAIPSGGISKFDGEAVKYDGSGHTINVAALEEVTLVADTPAFSYSLTSNGVYRSEPYYFTNACVTSFWYKISAANYEDYVHETRVTILPREVTLTSGSAYRYYNGEPLTCESFVVSGDGFVGADGVVVSYSGAQTNPGRSDNEFSYVFNEGTIADNYAITKQYGKLEVWALKKMFEDGEPTERTVPAGGVSKFDGEAVKYDGEGHTINVAALEQVTLVGDSLSFSYSLTSNGVYRSEPYYFANACVTSVWYKISAANYEDYVHEARVTILPREVTLTSGSASKNFDGTALRCEKIEVAGDGFIGTDGVNAVYFGSQLWVGTGKNTFDYSFKSGTIGSNYQITKAYGDLTVTATGTVVVDDSITRIPAEAFKDCADLTTVVLSENVTEIGVNAFAGCTKLKRITFPANMEIRRSWLHEWGLTDDFIAGYRVGDFIVINTTVLEYVGDKSVTSLTIPNGTTVIDDDALAGLDNLASVTFAGTERVLGARAFKDGVSLEAIDLPVTLEEIGTGAFENCTWMNRVAVDGGSAFPENLRRVGARAFYNCMELTSVVLPEGVYDIGDNAFYNCRGLISASLPHSLTNIGETAFGKCAKLTGVTAPTGLKPLAEIFPDGFCKVSSVTIPDGETEIIDEMFKDCEGVTRVVIPMSVANVGHAAFENCAALPSLALPDDIVSIGSAAFKDCSALSVVSLPKNLLAIADGLFECCSSLEAVIVPASVTSLGSCIFKESAVTEVKFLGNAPDYDDLAYGGTGDLTSYIVRGSMGWDYAETGIRTSRQKPDSWIGKAIEYWSPNIFEVTFDGNGGTPATYVAEQITDTTYSLPKVNPTRDGYVFKGWWTEPIAGGEVSANTICVANRAHTLYAHWEAGATVEVSFNPCGGTVTPDVRSYVSGTTYGGFPVPTRRGYWFQGWFTAAEHGEKVKEADRVPSVATTLYAQWKPVVYEVEFHANNGTAKTALQDFTFGESAALRANDFTWGEHNFIGWAKSPGGAVEFADKDVVLNLSELDAEDGGVVCLYARWSGASYAVRFDGNGGAGHMDNETFMTGLAQAIDENAFTREGYVFSGWARTPTGDVAYDDGEVIQDIVESGTVVLYAIWTTVGSERITVRFVPGEGATSELETKEYEVGLKYGTLPGATLKGYAMVGWFTAQTGGVLAGATSNVTAHTTLYAHWTPITYRVSFDGNGGAGNMSLQTFTYDQEQALDRCTFVKGGYDFVGWSNLAAGDVIYADGQHVKNLTATPSQTVPLYAVWQKTSGGPVVPPMEPPEEPEEPVVEPVVTNTITYVGLEGAVNTNVTEFTTNDLPLALGPVEREDWRFLGWTPNGGVIPAGTVTNVSFTALWEKIVEPSPVEPPEVPINPPEELEQPEEPVVEPVVTNTITYVGLKGAVNTNVTQFTTNDLPLVLGPVERGGWRFLGWTPNGGVISAGTVTNVTFTANWEEIVEPPPEEPVDPAEEPTGPTTPTNAPPTVVDEAETHVDVEKGEVAPFETAAAVYDGFLYDGEKVVGSVQVKVAKMKNGSAKVTATVQMAGQAKKISFKGGVADEKGAVTDMTDKDGNKLAVTVGVNGLGGEFRRSRSDTPYRIDGARNVFGGKSAADKAAASAADRYMNVYNVAFADGTLSVSVGKKGKAKIAGMVRGNKVSATSQIVVGKDAAVVPVVIVKKVNVAFCLWVMADGKVEVRGVDSVTSGEDAASPLAGKAETLKAGAKFSLADNGAAGARALPGLYGEYLPNGIDVAANGTKWVVAGGAKAGKVAFVKGGNTVDESKLGVNPSGLKLTYKQKDGTFKGSFKVYCLDGGKIKAYKANVTGVMIGAKGYGTATIKKPACMFQITIE